MFYERLKAENKTLRSDNEFYEETIKRLERELKHLEKKLKGDHVCGMHCGACNHGIANGYGYSCLLECKCKDFERRPE